MIITLAVIIVVLTSASVIGHQLEKAPEGFEDGSGFHFVTRDGVAGSRSVRTATTALVGADEGAAVASLS